jgi:hypothetical protein
MNEQTVVLFKLLALMRFWHHDKVVHQKYEWTASNNVTSCTNVVSLRVWYKFVNFNSTFVICLKLVFIEMLNKLITYIVCWYKTFIRSCLIHELTASLLVDIMIRCDTVSYNRLDLIQSLVPPHYVHNKYLFY